PVAAVVAPVVAPPATGKISIVPPKGSQTTPGKAGEVKLPVACQQAGGCAPQKLQFSGKAGKVKIAGSINVPALKAGQTFKASAHLDKKTLKALAAKTHGHVAKIKLTINVGGTPVVVTIPVKTK